MAYVDDVVMLVENEEMQSVIERLKQYLDRKKLETNTEKNKHENYEIQEGKWKRREKRLEREGKGNSENEGI